MKPTYQVSYPNDVYALNLSVNDAQGANAANWLSSITPSSYIRVSENYSSQNYMIFRVTGFISNYNAGTIYTVPVVYISGNNTSSILQNDYITVSYSEIGATGYTGITGATGTIKPDGINYGDYLYWNTNTSPSQWAVGDTNINIGSFAGVSSQGAEAVALGYQAGQTSQGTYAVAIGSQAGQNIQGSSAIAIGYNAGNSGQQTNAIAIGSFAGHKDQGTYSIAIGLYAGQTNQAASTIVLNAQGTSSVTGAIANATYIAPIRNYTQGIALGYNTTTSEVSYYNQNVAATVSGISVFADTSGNETLTVNFNNSFTSLTNYTATFASTNNVQPITRTITAYALSGGLVGGQYTLVIQLNIIPGAGTTFTFNGTSLVSIKTNFTTISVSVPSGSTETRYVALSFAYDGTNYYLTGSSFI